jgi:hypothetical protein|tara:strand:+ start:65 stop:511 length:447 start_codon:yes stop_codon:yes gene_type:complete
MDKELAEIIDTSIKIGLGALITGISAFYLNRQKHNHELTKATNAELRSTMKEMITYIENSETLVNRFTATVDKDDIGDIELLVNAEHEAYQARGLSHLLNDPGISDKVNKYALFIENIYSAAVAKEMDEYDALISQWSEHRNVIYKLL